MTQLALIIGQRHSRSVKLKGVEIDVLSMAIHFKQLNIPVITLLDSTAKELLTILSNLPKVDRLWFYYSGHKKEQYFELIDAKISETLLLSTLYSIPDSELILILDTCYGITTKFPINKKVVIFQASPTNQPALSTVWGSMFTKNWLASLKYAPFKDWYQWWDLLRIGLPVSPVIKINYSFPLIKLILN